MVEKFQKELSELQATISEECQQRQRIKLELDSKDSVIEQMQWKLSMLSVDSLSVNSGDAESATPESDLVPGTYFRILSSILDRIFRLRFMCNHEGIYFA